LASTQSKLYNIFLRLIHKKAFLGRQLAAGKFDIFSCPEPPTPISRSCNVSKFQINGRNVFVLKPREEKPVKHILYLHGGAYVQRFVRFHWKFLAELVNKGSCSITAPDYPLAPEYTYKDAFEMALALYKQMLETTTAEEIIIMGDSAGGGFALALAQKIRDEHINQPGGILLLSPWLDMTLTNPAIQSIEAADPFLEKKSLQRAGKLYAGTTAPDHYLLSPINGSLQDLGTITVFAGTKEILVADTRKLTTLAKAKGISLNYFEYPDMVHAWMFLNFPEAKKAKEQIIDLISSREVR
jgi:acetyl esterase/lipase